MIKIKPHILSYINIFANQIIIFSFKLDKCINE